MRLVSSAGWTSFLVGVAVAVNVDVNFNIDSVSAFQIPTTSSIRNSNGGRSGSNRQQQQQQQQQKLTLAAAVVSNENVEKGEDDNFDFHDKVNDSSNSGIQMSRRNMLFESIIKTSTVTAATAATATLLTATSSPSPANASGGATAGKYTTIPIAKRRYYGRVQAAVHDFLLIGPDMIKADMSASTIQGFFDPKGLVVVEAKRKDVNGQCTKKDGDCKGKEVRDSIYNDMKTSMYLLGNAFRLNQTKAPDNLPTVKAAKAFFKEMDLVEKAVKKGKKGDNDAVKHYAVALDALDSYLDLVELPPTDSGWYEQEFSRAVGDSARIT